MINSPLLSDTHNNSLEEPLKTCIKSLLSVVIAAGFAGQALADINVGVIVSATGPAASLGIPEKNTIALLPASIGGEKINYVVLDDASDTTTAVKNTRKLLSEDKVDLIVGSTITPNSPSKSIPFSSVRKRTSSAGP